jgi:hypothetical protein
LAVSRTQFEAVCWSFNIAQETGRWPEFDQSGVPLSAKDGHRFLKRGQLLNASDKRPVFVGICGDWKWWVDEFSLSPNYKGQGPDGAICHLCRAVTKESPLCAWDASAHAGWTATSRTTAEHQTFSPLAGIKGYSIHNFYEDFLHDDLQGVRPSVVASVLFLACEHQLFDENNPQLHTGGTWQDRLQARLNKAYLVFCKWANAHGLAHSVAAFKVCHMTLKTLSSVPYMKGKAHNMATLSMWGLTLTEKIKDRSEELNVLHMVVHGMVDFWNLAGELKARDTLFLSKDEQARLETSRLHALQGYCHLWRWAQHNGVARYSARPKLHKLDHCLRRSCRTGLIFSSWWSFCDEDGIADSAKVCAISHATTMGVRPTQRWLLSFMSKLGEL